MFTNTSIVICKMIVGGRTQFAPTKCSIGYVGTTFGRPRAADSRPYKHAPTFLNVGADIIRPPDVSQKEKDML